MNLCNEHLIDDVTRKAKRDLIKDNLLPGKIAAALIGGKGSSAFLYLLHTILAPNRGIRIVASRLRNSLHLADIDQF
jgi:tRNA(Ile)-lysidine synthase TilS/MesJ